MPSISAGHFRFRIKQLLFMRQGGFGAVSVDTVFFFFQDFFRKLPHEAAANAFSYHGSWPHWMSNVFVDTVGMPVPMAVRMAM